VKKSEKISSEDGKDRVKDEGHYKYEIDEVIQNRFKAKISFIYF